MRHKNQQHLDAHKPTRRTRRELVPALVVEAMSSRTPSPEAKAAMAAWMAVQRMKRVGPW